MWYHVGSAREKPGRTGFAHLFEHLMFMGSGHVKPGEFDDWLEAAGGDNNGSTENDRTNYWINVPSNSLELALFLESDRMGYLLDSMTPKTRRRAARRRQERAAAELREPAVRRWPRSTLGEMLYPEGPPVSLAGDRLHGRISPRRATTMWWRSSRSTTRRRTRASSSPATSTRRRARTLVEKWFGDVKPARAP